MPLRKTTFHELTDRIHAAVVVFVAAVVAVGGCVRIALLV